MSKSNKRERAMRSTTPSPSATALSPVIIQMDGNYPDISSGIVSFENMRTSASVKISAPKDLFFGIYGIKSITMDSGAGYTILPESLALPLDISIYLQVEILILGIGFQTALFTVLILRLIFAGGKILI